MKIEQRNVEERKESEGRVVEGRVRKWIGKGRMGVEMGRGKLRVLLMDRGTE